MPPDPEDEDAMGAPVPDGTDVLTAGDGPGHRRLGRPVLLSGVAFIALVGGAGVALAASHGSSTPLSATAAAATPSPSASAGPAEGHGYGWGGRFFGGGAFGAVHGQLVLPKAGGGYQTVDIQRGQVTAVSAASITVKSDDGFTRTYAVTSATIVDAQRDGIGSVKTGDQVSLQATVSGSSATAASIADLSGLQSGRHAFNFPEPAEPPSPGTTG
jgi:hypothetical protein